MNPVLKAIELVLHLIPYHVLTKACSNPSLAPIIIKFLDGILLEESQDATVTNGPIAGSKLILNIKKHKYFWLGTYEPWVQKAISQYLQPGMYAWDIGAFIGYYTLLMRRVAGFGRIVAIEPDPESFSILKKHLTINGYEDVVTLPVAVGARQGRVRLERVPGGPSQTKVVECDNGEFNQITLDDLLDRFPAPGVVKMDIEGAEADALAGGTRLLEEIRPVWIIELHGYQGEQALKQLRKAGYQIMRIDKWVGPSADLLGGGSEHVVALPL